MRVSPLDIRKQEFTRTFRGYEIEEVQAFLQMISREWEEMRDEHRRLEEQVRAVEDKLRHYERVEEALQEALQTARDSSRKTVQNAEERARNIIKAAESKASQIEGEAVAQREKLRQENSRLLNRQHEIVARLRAFLSSEIEMLERYEGNQLVGSKSAEVEREAEPARRGRRSAMPPVELSPAPKDEAEEQEQEVGDGAEPSSAHGGNFKVRPLLNRAEGESERRGAEAALDEEEPLPSSAESGYGTEPEVEEEEHRADDHEKTKARQATEEIEKIRRILNDLD